ncbi:hypothetical protein AB6G58_09165 [Providencia huaxiensis]
MVNLISFDEAHAPTGTEVPVGWCVDCGMAVYVRVQLALSFVPSIGYE